MPTPISLLACEAGPASLEALRVRLTQALEEEQGLGETSLLLVPTASVRQLLTQQELRKGANASFSRINTPEQLARHLVAAYAPALAAHWRSITPVLQQGYQTFPPRLQLVASPRQWTGILRHWVGSHPPDHPLLSSSSLLEAFQALWLEEGPFGTDWQQLQKKFSATELYKAIPLEDAMAWSEQWRVSAWQSGLLPASWAWPLIHAYLTFLAEQEPATLAQLTCHLRRIAVLQWQALPRAAQDSLLLMAQSGTSLLIADTPQVLNQLTSITDQPRMLEALPLLGSNETLLASPVATLPDVRLLLSVAQGESTVAPLEKPVASLDWLHLETSPDWEAEVTAVSQYLVQCLTLAEETAIPRVAIVVPDLDWKSQWLEALTAQGFRESKAWERLTLSARVNRVALIWLTLFRTVLAIPANPQEEPPAQDLTPDWPTLVHPFLTELGLTQWSTSLTQASQQAFLAMSAGEPVAHWLPPLLTQWGQATGQPLEAQFWQAVHLAVLKPLERQQTVLNRLPQLTLLERISWWLETLAQPSGSFERTDGLPFSVLTGPEALWQTWDQVVVVSLSTQVPVGLSALFSVAPDSDPKEDDTSALIDQWLPAVMETASTSLWISTHEGSTGWTPSDWIHRLQEAASELTGQPWQNSPLTAPHALAETSPLLVPTLPLSWNTLPPQPSTEPIWPAHQPLPVSPSSLETYMKCPRQYFYSRMMRLPDELPDEGATALMLGQLGHALLEGFNRQVTPETHTVEQLLAFTQQSLDIARHRYQPPPPQWQAHPLYQRYKRLSVVEREDLTQKLLGAFASLGEQGYFDQPIVAIWPEVKLQNIPLAQWQDATLTVTADALIQRENGEWDLVDYKHYGSSSFSKADPQKNAEPLAQALEDFPLEAATHEERFPKKELSAKKRLLQLPLYYYAFQQEGHRAVEQDQPLVIRQLSLQLLRSPKANQPETGSIALRLPVEIVENRRLSWLGQLQEGIIHPVRQAQTFDTSPEPAQCGHCAYNWLCDRASLPELEEA